MKEVAPVISRETSMWNMWIGFNTTHSFGAILFGALYLYLPLAHADLFFRSSFLVLTGLMLLAGYVVVARLYWFSVPFRGTVGAAGLYLLGLVVRFA